MLSGIGEGGKDIVKTLLNTDWIVEAREHFVKPFRLLFMVRDLVGQQHTDQLSTDDLCGRERGPIIALLCNRVGDIQKDLFIF